LVTVSESFEGIQEDGAGVGVVEIREAVVTTEGDEMIVAFGLVSLQTAGHWISLWPGVRVRM
jgi:hypothetical protein